MFGDGAYTSYHEHLSGGRFVPRVSVEWMFGDLKKLFSFIDYKKDLKLLESPLTLTIFTAMILYNAYVTMFGSEVSDYFDANPVTFENWIQYGPRHI